MVYLQQMTAKTLILEMTATLGSWPREVYWLEGKRILKSGMLIFKVACASDFKYVHFYLAYHKTIILQSKGVHIVRWFRII